MVTGTRVLAPSLGNLAEPTPDDTAPLVDVTVHARTALALAMDLCKRHGSSVGVVSAVSGYLCGGGFLAGGKHALEEAFCVQTTLYDSLRKARNELSCKLGERGLSDASSVGIKALC